MKKAHVFLVGGQSNTLGISPNDGIGDVNISDNILLYQRGSLTGIRKINIEACEKFMPVTKGLGFTPSCFGLELGIANYLSENLSLESEDKAFILKFACDGTALNNEWVPPSTNRPVGKHFTGFINHIKDGIQKIKEMGFEIEIHAFSWLQGSTDATVEEHANNYYTYLVHFYNDIKRELNLPNLRIVVGKINRNNKLMPYCDTVISAQEKFCLTEKNATIIETSDLKTLEYDLWHYNAPSELELGRRVAKALI